MTQPRVVILQNYYTPYRAALFTELRTKNLHLRVIYYQIPENEGRKWRPAEDLPYESARVPSRQFRKLALFTVPKALFADADTVILLDDNPSSLSMALLALRCRLHGVRRLLWVEHIPDSFKSRAKRLYQNLCSRMLLMLSDATICFSQMSAAYVRALDRTIPINPMVQATPEPNQLSPRTPGEPIRRFGYLGSEGPRKNVDTLIRAFSSLADPNLELHLAGFNGHSDDPRVHWHGYVDGDARERFFAGIDILVLPSQADPWGLVINEALQRGCLAIASNRCGSSELVAMIDERLVTGTEQNEIATTLAYARTLDRGTVIRLHARACAAMTGYSIEAAATAMHDAIARGHRPALAPLAT
ncbi:glycosyltransferase family 4 protein [Sphingomonas abietis]|uniref:Glycosyltransferase family 4 protein n=1 Tax=Sphingomonas abietis TaxID=3012344 RepID=A0ABY7NHN7_9SPHN|nr:glycosyltransferase family 4 protein [Sphingomonas abietis]WBO20838.1 glycosyltransferase family 4 protein [Sphingomonas abietis]